MLTGPTVLLILKVAVSAVTLLPAASLVALARGRIRLHGRINMVFFVVTMVTVVAFEVLIRFIEPGLTQFLRQLPYLGIHLCFSISTTLMMPVMLYTGLAGRRRLHLTLAWVFAVAWLGTLITGVFFLNPPEGSLSSAPG